MTPLKPYLIRSIYEWIVDNNLTPHILVDATMPGVDVPTNWIEGGSIVLNINPQACEQLVLGDEVIAFNARFSGNSMGIIVPIEAVKAIYARENGQGMIFDDEPKPEAPVKKKPALRVVK